MFGTNLTIELPAEISTWDGGDISQKSFDISTNKPYKAYPILHWELNSFAIVWEGYCYTGNESFHSLFKNLQEALLQEDIVAIQRIVKTIQHHGGEFACWMIGKKSLYFFNDSLGRLPVYSYRDNRTFFIGRNLNSFFEKQQRVPDKLGIAQTLWCGYALGNKTLFENVRRVSFGTFLQFSFATGECVERNIHSFDFTVRKNQALEQAATNLTQSFKQACARIADAVSMPLHLSLSGGQDSRAVLAGMQQTGANLSASSFSFSATDSDANTSALLAKKMELPWQNILISPSNDTDDWLIQLKCGLNYSGMAFIESYLRQSSLSHPDSVMLTGDGGDKVLPFLGEPKIPTSESHLVLLLLRRHAILNAEIAAKVCGLHIDDLRQSLLDVIRKYPEQSLMDKSIHFTVFERGAKAYFEGEDRNRFFMWSTTPFYDLDFFNMAMAVPDEYKKNYTLYRHFMQLLAPELVGIPDAGGGTINSKYFKSRKWVQEQFRSASPVMKQSLRSIKQFMQAESSTNSSVQMPASVPASLHFLDTACFEKLIQKGGQESALHLRTILKTFA